MTSIAYVKRVPSAVRALALFTAVAGFSCGDDDDTSGETKPDGSAETTPDASDKADASVDGGAQDEAKAVEISFEAKVGDKPFSCTSEYDLPEAKAFRDLRFYVYDVRLVSEDGSEAEVTLDQNDNQYKNAALLDFEDGTGSCGSGSGSAATYTKLTGKAKASNIKGVAFRVGLPAELNHSDPAKAPSPLNVQTLAWSWTAGRVYFQLNPESPTQGAYNVHVGSGSCSGNANAGEAVTCKLPNIADISLTGFDPATHKVVLDVAKVIAGVDPNPPGHKGGAGCMSMPGNAVCAAYFATFGISGETGLATGTQTVFSAATK